MSKYTYIGQVVSGKLELTKPTRAKMAADIYALDGKRVEVEIKKLPRRSNPQNAYYWGVVVDMVKDGLRGLGHDVDANDTHYFLKDKFNGKAVVNEDAEVVGMIGVSTTKMNKVDFMSYLSLIQIWAAQYLNINIPDPEKQMEMFTPEPSDTPHPAQFAR